MDLNKISISMQLQKCIGTAVIAMGPERLLDLVPVSLNARDFTCLNIWLVPILKNHVVGASLGYYIEHIMPLAKSFQLASSKGIYFIHSFVFACLIEMEEVEICLHVILPAC